MTGWSLVAGWVMCVALGGPALLLVAASAAGPIEASPPEGVVAVRAPHEIALSFSDPHATAQLLTALVLGGASGCVAGTGAAMARDRRRGRPSTDEAS